MNDKIRNILAQTDVNINELRDLSIKGFSSQNRENIWKLLLGYLPQNKEKWNTIQENNKQIYESFLEDYFSKQQQNKINLLSLQPEQVEQIYQMEQVQQTDDIRRQKHDIIQSVFENQTEYTQNQSLWEHIEKDTMRTKTDLQFFQQKCSQNQDVKFQYISPIVLERIANNDLKMQHKDILGRILFIYGKTNSAVKYVQGMNELLSNIYIVYQNCPTHESDVFFSFIILMSQMKDNFIQYQEKDHGIKAQVERLENMLRKLDPQIWDHLNSQNISLYYFAYRWLILLFSHELNIDHLLVLWDNILAQQDYKLFAIYFSISILRFYKAEILSMGFGDILMLLQNIQIKDIFVLIDETHKIIKQDKN